MELDDLIRSEVRSFRPAFDPAAEAEAIRARVRRRRSRRWRTLAPIAAVAATAVAVVAIGFRPDGGDSVRLSTQTTTSTAPTTTLAPDPLAAAGVCRSLLPTTVDPLDPSPTTTAVPDGGPPSTVAPTIALSPEPEVDTPCGRAVAADLEARIASTWRPWDDNPFGNAAVEETAPPDSYGTVAVSLTDDSGAILLVTVGFGAPGDGARMQGFGRPLDDLPDGWTGTTDFVDGEDRMSADVTVVRPGRLPVMVAVKLGNPGMGAPQPAGSVLPMTYDEVRALAIAIATDGPVQSP